jgi:hypothetical protein
MKGTRIAEHMNLTRITLKDPGAQDGTSSRKERVLHSYTYHACLTSKFRSIVDGIPVFNAGPCALHWPNWCRDMFDIRRSTTQAWTTEPLWEKHRKSRIPICLTVFLCIIAGGRTTAQEPSKGKNALTEQYKLEYDLRARVDHGLSPQLKSMAKFMYPLESLGRNVPSFRAPGLHEL